MTWKSYAAVSGATVLAGWLAASPPANAPGTAAVTTVPQRDVAGTSGPSEIELEAARLQARVQREVEFQRPERNPFRFGAARRPRSVEAPAAVIAPPPVELPPPPPPVTLSGFAEDQVGDRLERTAILSSPSGVLLVREGDTVMGLYKVARIDGSAVELEKIADGTVLRLMLGN